MARPESGEVKCLDCDALFDPRPTGRGPSRVRCGKHRALRKKQLQRARTAQLRAERFGVASELVIADEVFERDKWACHLCGEPIPEHLRSSGFRAGEYQPLAPVVDHVVPLSKGGSHTMANCSTAHWTCNAKKFDREALSGAKAELPPQVRKRRGSTCSVDGCDEKALPKQMCSLHHGRMKRVGHPLKMRCGCGCGEAAYVDPKWSGLFYIDGHGVQTNAIEPGERLRQNLVAQPVSDRGVRLYDLTDDCLIWTGPQASKGYGAINIRAGKRITRRYLVHRLAYELAFGEGSAVGLTIDHLCGVPLCCNPNHLEAVSHAENVRRTAVLVMACPQGHLYDERNTLFGGVDGHRRCRQCNRNRYHKQKLGHDFVLDEENSSTKRERCLTCRLKKESTPQFCPYGHEYTPENRRIDSQGKRSCNQCIRNRTHVAQFDHEFVVDETNPSSKRQRCAVCVQNTEPATHCRHGHEYTALTVEYTKKGKRNCVQCRLNKAHVAKYNHEFVIDPNHTGKLRRCLKCVETAVAPTHCANGHEYTPQTTKYHSTRGTRLCVICQNNVTHVPNYGHEFVIDPNHTGKLRRCLVCFENK